jgi:hypothetical protein
MAFGTKRAKPFKKLLTCRVFHVHDVVEDEIIAFFVDPSCTISPQAATLEASRNAVLNGM